VKKAKGIVKEEIINDIISMIIQGTLNEGDLLPSIRSMSTRYNVSRGTILVVYKQLESIGYIQGFERSGYVVLRQDKPLSSATVIYHEETRLLPLSQPVEQLARFMERKPCRLPVHFIKRWVRNYEKNHNQRNVTSSASYLPRFLKLSRRLEISDQSLLLLPGYQEALTLVALFLKQETQCNTVLIEQPCDTIIRRLFIQFNFQVIDILVDENGLMVEDLPTIPFATLLCMPSLQYPTATQLSHERKEKLHLWALHNQAIIIEDDRFAMLSFGKNISPPLLSHSSELTIIYLTHLFEMIGTTYNLGLMVVPKHLSNAFYSLHSMTTSTPLPTNVYIVGDFLASSYFMKYLTSLIEERQHKAALAYNICTQHLSLEQLNFHEEAGFCYCSTGESMIPDEFINTFFFPIIDHNIPHQIYPNFIFPYAQLTITELEKMITQLTN